jgi:hypothetical protein
MKLALKIAILVILALCIGYNRGYYEGLRAERQAWESTAESNQSIIRVGDTDQPPHFVPYRNPHSGIFFFPAYGKMPVNVVDPRSIRAR